MCLYTDDPRYRHRGNGRVACIPLSWIRRHINNIRYIYNTAHADGETSSINLYRCVLLLRRGGKDSEGSSRSVIVRPHDLCDRLAASAYPCGAADRTAAVAVGTGRTCCHGAMRFGGGKDFSLFAPVSRPFRVAPGPCGLYFIFTVHPLKPFHLVAATLCPPL